MLLTLLLLPFIAACLLPAVAGGARNRLTAVTALAAIAGLVLLAGKLQKVLDGQTLSYKIEWIAQYDQNLSLRLDGLSLLFALMILGIGLLVIVHTHYYLAGHERAGIFYISLSLFMWAMLGVLLTTTMPLLLLF